MPRSLIALLFLPAVTATAPIAISADPLPTKDSGAPFGSHHGLGFHDGTLYLHTGDSIYIVDMNDPLNPSFTLHMNGLRSAFGGPERAFEGAFAVGDGGHALVSMGFNDGGVLTVDLANQTALPIKDFDRDNIFSATGRSDQTFYTTWVDPGFTTSTLIYHIDANTRATQAVVDPAVGTGEASGGMAFDAAGNLVVGSFDFINGRAKFYRILAADLLAFENGGMPPPTTLLGEGPANGNAHLVVASNETIFFNTTTGIGRFDPGSGTVDNVYRDITDPKLFHYDAFRQPLNGLAYDEDGQHLVTAEFNTAIDAYELIMIRIPEPASVLFIFFASTLALMRSGSHRRGRIP